MADSKQQLLVRALKERQIPLHEEVSQAFSDLATKDALASWVHEYVLSPTLLTSDELDFHNNRFKSGALNTTGETLPHRALDDTEFEAAISSLEASTAAIEKQCQIMEQQKQALQQLKARNANSKAASLDQEERQSNSSRIKAQLEFQVGELADSIQEQLRTSTKQTDAAVSTLPTAINRVLEKDDRLLDGLQKILPRITDASEERKGSAAEIERLCQALTTLMAQEARARIDSAYISHVSSASQANGHSPKDAKQRASVLAELSELSSEIDSLASMAVDGKYRQTIMRELKDATSDTEIERKRWAEYMLATMQFLTRRLTALDNHAHHLHTYQAVIAQVNAAHQSITVNSAAPKHDTQIPLRSSTTPVAKGLKPLRLVQANISEPHDAVSQLLRSFEIRVKDPTDTAKLAETLTQAKKDHIARVQQLGNSTERGITDQLADSITKADRDIQDLLGVVYSHTLFGTVRLQDEDLHGRVGELELVTNELSEEMRSLDVEKLAQEIRKKQKEMLE